MPPKTEALGEIFHELSPSRHSGQVPWAKPRFSLSLDPAQEPSADDTSHDPPLTHIFRPWTCATASDGPWPGSLSRRAISARSSCCTCRPPPLDPARELKVQQGDTWTAMTGVLSRFTVGSAPGTVIVAMPDVVGTTLARWLERISPRRL